MTLTTVLMLLIKTSLITLMVSLGLGLQPRKLAERQHQPWLVLRVVLGSCVLVPLVALLLLKLPISQQMPAGARLGIALMALSPSAPLTLRKAGIHGGDAHLAAVLQVAAAMLAVVSIPLLSDLFRAVFDVPGWDIRPSPVALQVGFMQVLPLTVGLLLRHWRAELGARWALPVQNAALLVSLSVVGLIVFMMLPKLLGFVSGNLPALAAMLWLTAAALAIGYALGGGSREQRLTTALVTSMRNPGLALLFAVTHGPEMPEVKLAIVAYLLVTILVSIPFLHWASKTPTT